MRCQQDVEIERRVVHVGTQTVNRPVCEKLPPSVIASIQLHFDFGQLLRRGKFLVLCGEVKKGHAARARASSHAPT